MYDEMGKDIDAVIIATADHTPVSYTHLYRNNRVLPFILLGGKVLYPETGLREVLETNYRKPLE